MICQYFGLRILWMKYSASRNKNNFWLNLWAKCEFAKGLVNTEPRNHFINILFSPCLCKEVSNLKEMRSGICPWPLKVWEGEHELCWQKWECTWDSCYQGVLLIALITSFACLATLPRQLNLFCGNFWTPAVHRLPFKANWCWSFLQMSGSEWQWFRAYFTTVAVFLAILIHVLSTCATKTLDLVEVMDTNSSHTIFEFPCAATSEHSVQLEQLVPVHVRERLFLFSLYVMWNCSLKCRR